MMLLLTDKKQQLFNLSCIKENDTSVPGNLTSGQRLTLNGFEYIIRVLNEIKDTK